MSELVPPVHMTSSLMISSSLMIYYYVPIDPIQYIMRVSIPYITRGAYSHLLISDISFFSFSRYIYITIQDVDVRSYSRVTKRTISTIHLSY